MKKADFDYDSSLRAPFACLLIVPNYSNEIMLLKRPEELLTSLLLALSLQLSDIFLAFTKCFRRVSMIMADKESRELVIAGPI